MPVGCSKRARWDDYVRRCYALSAPRSELHVGAGGREVSFLTRVGFLPKRFGVVEWAGELARSGSERTPRSPDTRF
jgi:hypothetical protein